MVFFGRNILVFGEKPHCNKFSFEEQLLEKMVRLEFKVENMFNSISKSQSDIEDLALKVKKELDVISEEKEGMILELTKHKTDTGKQIVDVGKKMAHQFNDFRNKMVRFSGDLHELRNQTASRNEGKLHITSDILQRVVHLSMLSWNSLFTRTLQNIIYKALACFHRNHC